MFKTRAKTADVNAGTRSPEFRNSLYGRVLVVNLVLIAALAVGLAAWFFGIEKSSVARQFESAAVSRAERIGQQVRSAVLAGRTGELPRLLAATDRAEDVLFLRVYDCTGREIASVVRPEASALTSVAPPCSAAAAKSSASHLVGAGVPVIKAQAQVPGTTTSDSAAHVVLALSTSAERAVFLATVWKTVGATLIAVLILAVVLNRFLRRTLQPADQLLARIVETVDSRNPAPTSLVGTAAAAFNDVLSRLTQAGERRDCAEKILCSLGESLILFDRDWRIIRVNCAALKLLGYTEQELLELTPDHVQPNRPLGAQPAPGERTYVGKGGRAIPVLFSETTLRDASGAREGTVWVAVEISELKKFQLELMEAKTAAERASDVKSKFMANVSHELRTPLNAIINYAEMLVEDCQSRRVPELIPDLRKITRSGRRLLGVINDVLDLSKIEAGKMQVRAARFEIGAVIRDVVDAVKPLAEMNGNTLEVYYPQGLEMLSDNARFHQSLLNLAGNACKFTRQGSIRIMAGATDEWVRVDVCDTGIGIAAAQLEKLFQPFVQADPSANTRFGGSGLGLTISRELCRMMGGDITAESVPGQGSTFTMQVPRMLAAGNESQDV